VAKTLGNFSERLDTFSKDHYTHLYLLAKGIAMELHTQPESPLTDLTDRELVDLLDEHYFTLVTTGEEAVNNVAWDIAQGVFAEYHGLDDARMGIVLVLFAKRMSRYWKTDAITAYRKEGN